MCTRNEFSLNSKIDEHLSPQLKFAAQKKQKRNIKNENTEFGMPHSAGISTNAGPQQYPNTFFVLSLFCLYFGLASAATIYLRFSISGDDSLICRRPNYIPFSNNNKNVYCFCNSIASLLRFPLNFAKLKCKNAAMCGNWSMHCDH